MLFSTIVPRVETSIFNQTSSSSSNTEVDGLESIAMLTVLTQFAISYNTTTTNPTENGSNSIGKRLSSMKLSPLNQSNYNFDDNSSGREQMHLDSIYRLDSNVDQQDSNNFTTAAGIATSITSNTLYYLNHIVELLRSRIVAKIQTFVSDQVNWINNQRADVKSPAILLPFTKFPTLLQQVNELTNGMVRAITCVLLLLFKCYYFRL